MPEALRRLDHRARGILGLFAGKETITAPQVAAELGPWVEDGWLEKGKSVTACPKLQSNGKISAINRQLIGNASEDEMKEN
jgi:hypothetical protein